MIFKAYEHEQIREILEERLSALGLSIFNKVSLEMVSRRAATVAGDLRAALKICQRTIELHRDQEAGQVRLLAEFEEAKRALATAEAHAFNLTSSQSYTAANAGAPRLSQAQAPGPTHTAHSAGLREPPPGKSLMMLVKQAADEYKESPMMATVNRLCAIDKAILISVCKHLRASNDETEITAAALWDRLGDLLHRARSKQGVPLPPPPFIYNEALDRLVEQGLLTQTQTGRRSATEAASGEQVHRGPFSLRLEFTDVVVALKGDSLLGFL